MYSQPVIIDLHPVEFNHNLFMVSPDKWNGSCNTVDDLSAKTCISNRTKDANVKVFNMITGVNEAKSLINHISCDRKRKVDSTKCNSNHKWNNDKFQGQCKTDYWRKIDYSSNPSICICEIGANLKSVDDDPVITCDKITNTTNAVPMNYDDNSVACDKFKNVASTVPINSDDNK